ncbi:MAG: glycosyltransferase family 4 protein [Anaerolineales bacterium]|nr:glycosyltransferase family 4 protein [Anaerolineales bacterium]
MRVLFLHGVGDLYGASRCLVRLASALREDGHEVEVWLPDAGPIVTKLESAGVACELAPELRGITRNTYHRRRSLIHFLSESPGRILSLSRKIRAARPDVVHTNMATLVTAGLAARLSGRPHLWHVREWFGEFSREWVIFQWLLRVCSDRIVCISKTVADQFHPVIRKKTRIIYDGLSDSEIQAVSQARVQAFKSKFGLERHPAVGVVGRIKWKRKGQEVFLRAASLLRNEFPQTRFLCIGSPFPGNEDHLESLQRLAAELGMNHMWIVTGDVDENLAAIAALDILVHPPCQPEPFGMVVTEAMALGKPVIGSDLGGIKEQVENNRTGLLIPPNDPPALAEAIKILLNNETLRLTMGARGRARCRECFSWESFYRSMLEEYYVLAPPPTI